MSCGPGRLGDWLVPDGPWAAVCEEHDHLYRRGGTPRDRLEADLLMLSCMFRVAYTHHGIVMRMILQAWALVYFVAVRALGWRFFRWTTKDSER